MTALVITLIPSPPHNRRNDGRDTMDALQRIAAAKARRFAHGFLADNGIACRSAAERDYYNARDKWIAAGRPACDAPRIAAMRDAVNAEGAA